MATLFTSTFDLVPGSATYGKLTIVATLSSGGADNFVAVDGPFGELRAYPVAPDGGDSFSIEVTLPLDSDGEVANGDYVIYYKKVLGGNTTILKDTYCLTGGTVQQLDVTVEEDCTGYNLFFTDASSYPDGVTADRSWTIQHPVIPPTTTPVNSTGESSGFSVSLVRSNGLAYRNVSYQVVLEAEITEEVYQQIDVFKYVILYKPEPYNQEYVVSCGGDLCGEFSCIDNTLRALLDKACEKGGIAALPKHEADKFSLLLSSMALYNNAVRCQDWATARYYKNLIFDINGDCPQATTPQAINSSVAYSSNQWVTVPDEEFQNGYASNIGSPLQFRVRNGYMQFRGKVGGNAFVTSGLTMINPLYWTNLGIGVFDRVVMTILDAETSNDPKGCIGYAYFVSQELKVFFTADVDPTHDFFLSGIVQVT